MKIFNKVLRKTVLGLLVCVFLLQPNMFNLLADGEPASFLDAVSDYVVMLEKLTSTAPSQVFEEVQNGDTISFNDTLRVAYDVTINNSSGSGGKLTDLWNAINALGTGAEYYIEFELTIPDGLKYNDFEQDIKINTGTDSAPNLMYFATLYPAPDGSGVFLRFKKQGFWAVALASTEEVEAGVYVTCNLDDNALGNRHDAIISLDGTAIVNIELSDTLPGNHTLAKSADFVTGTADASSNQVIEWTATYTAGSDSVIPPITFYDTFDSLYNTYVVGSFRVSVDGGGTYTTEPPNVEHSTTDDMIALSYVYSGAVTANQVIIFKYRTMLTNESLYGGANDTVLTTFYNTDLTLKNHAEMRVRDTMYADADGSIVVKPNTRDNHWLAKNVTNADSNNVVYGQDIISWEVDVRAFDLGFEYLYLYDTIAKGLTLLPDTLKISVDGGNTYQLWSSYTSAALAQTPEANGTTTMKLTLPTNGGKYYQSYRVIYDTRVAVDYLMKVDGNYYIVPSEFDNKAWLDFAWPAGYGPRKPQPPEVVLTGVGVDVPIIIKEGTYHADTHKITWTVTVNPFGIEIVDGTIMDDFTNTGISSPASTSDRNMKFLPGTFSSDKNAIGNAYFTLNPGYNATGAIGKNEFGVTVNGLGKNTAKFTFETEVLDEKNTEYNSSRTYTNNVTFDGHVNLYNTDGSVASSNYHVKDTSTAVPTVTSTVLSKAAGTYNYTDNSITWTITVNQNKMVMNGAYIVDTIPQYLYVDTSTINVTAAGASTFAAFLWDYRYTVSETNTTPATKTHAAAGTTSLKVDLGDLTNQTVTITYKTKLLVDEPAFKSTYSRILKNSVVLNRSDLGPTPSVSASRTVTNKILDKSGAFVMDSDGVNTSSIDYIVNINPHGMNLNGYTLIDTLPKGLELDINSVTLWNATVSSGGVITKTNTPASGYTWDYQYSASTRSFTVKLPGDKPYVLTYTCIIVSGGTAGTTFTNSIAFEQPAFDGNTGAVSTGFLSYGGWALSRAKGSLSLKITKRDSKDRAELQDVKFELLTLFVGDSEPTVIMEGQTDENGELTFYPLNFLRTYWIRETSGIAGYMSTGTAFAVDSNSVRYELDNFYLNVFTTDAVNNVMSAEIEIYNNRDEYAFSFYKVSDTDLTLSGGTFKITDVDDPAYVRTATSGRNGVVLFENVRWGEYKLVETAAPDDYILDDNIYTVSIAKDGSYFIKDSNGNELTGSSRGEAKIVNTHISSQSPDEPTPTDPTPSDPDANNPTPSDPDANNPTPSDPDANNPTPSNPDANNPTPSDSNPSDPDPNDASEGDKTTSLPKTGAPNLYPAVIVFTLLGFGLVLSGLLLRRIPRKKKDG